MPIATINPATGETLRTFDPQSGEQIEAMLARAASVFREWRASNFSERANCLLRAAAVLESEREALARLMTTEMGKTIRSARDEVVKCAAGCRHYAETGEKSLADEIIETNASRSFVHYQPLGPVLAIMPWNFPFWQVFRFAAPALMAGNVCLLKHASNVPQCALAIEDVFRRSGLPEGAFQTLLIESAQVEAVLRDTRVAAVTLTGSEPAGRKVASQAGGLIKKTVLELGGSDPFLVMPSADLDAAVSTAVKARTINNGQSCIAAKRFIVDATIYPQFEARFVEGMRSLRVGDPMSEDTDVGPLATPQIREDLSRQVSEARQAGASVLTGGKVLGGPGNYFEPTVLSGLPRHAPVYQEEFFGPVALLFRSGHLEDAIGIANDTPFGLGASAWTQDRAEQNRLVSGIEAGQVFLNAMVASDPRLPFGGIKNSGYGRELGVHGIREFVNAKTVWIGASGETR